MENTVKFIPPLPVSGKYTIYVYYPARPDMASKIRFDIYNGRTLATSFIRKADIQVEGQTSGAWISIGTYHLQKDKSAVTIRTENADGIVVADAVLFVPRK